MTAATPGPSIFIAAAAPPPVPAAPVHASHGRAILVALVCVLVALLARIWLISVFGSSLPFWDQWGAEGALLYQPMLEDRFDPKVLWSSHNEHRIALTRLVAMALFALNDGQWDVRVQLLANALIFALALGVLVYYLKRHVPPHIAKSLIVLCVLIGVLPFSWENTLAGFQNAFYFLFLTTVLLLWLCAHRATSPGNFLLLAALAVLTGFTLGTGLLTFVACLAVLFLRWYGRHDSVRGLAMFGAVLLAALTLALATLVRTDAHLGLGAVGVFGHLRALAFTASWPLPPPALLLFAAPFIAYLWILQRERRYVAADAFFAGLFVWIALLALATAHSRGNGLRLVPSRYTDLFALGSLSYAYFALRMLPAESLPGWRRWVHRAMRLTPAAIAVGFVAQSLVFWPYMVERRFLTRIEAINVRAFLEGDPTALDGKPPFYIPVPEPAPLASALAIPTFRAMLPASIVEAGASAATPVRACAWRPKGDGPPLDGEIDCAAAPAADAVGVGRLSAIAFGLWERLYTDTFPSFRESPDTTAPLAARGCALDAVNGGPTQQPQQFRVYYPSIMRLSGWIGSVHDAAGRFSTVRFGLSGTDGRFFVAEARGRQQRPDVVAARNEPAQLWSGFNVAVSGSALAAGRYRVFLGDGSGYCDTGHAIDVAKAADERLDY